MSEQTKGKEMKQSKEIVVTQDEAKPVAVEIMAQAIVDISEAMKRISRSRLNRKALITLIHDDTGLYKKSIENVLTSLDSLEKTYLK
jgi:hypothetical protein